MSQTDSQEVKSIFSFTEKIVDTCGPRITGDASTHKAAEMIREEFATYCDSTDLESFDVHPNAFLGSLKLLVVVYSAVVICFWLQWPVIAIIGLTFGFLALLLETIFYHEILDPFWKKKQGMNVIGVVEPTNEVKQQVVLSGHHDSANIFNYLTHFPKLYPFLIGGAFITVMYVLIFGSAWAIFSIIPGVDLPQGVRLFIQISATVLSPLIGALWFFTDSTGTPGAGDNLISVSIASELGKKFAREKLQHTRIIIASFDAEESGLRGARAYCKKHKEGLLAIPTFNFNMDCPYVLKELSFLTTDVNGTVRLSEEMATECVSIAKSFGYEAKAFPIPFLIGGCDSGEFGRIGVDATNLSAMSIESIKHEGAYHTPNDTVDKIEPGAVKAAFQIATTFVQNKDQQSI